MPVYTVVTLEIDGAELASTEEETFKAAKATGVVQSKDRELIRSGAHKVEVRDSTGECLWDRLMVMTQEQLKQLEL
jgi:hypothetical protein